MKLQVLVTTMHQTDLSIAKKMNISGAVLFANQADRYDYEKLERESGTAEMVTTPTRGLSKNRNIALECCSSQAEYIMFSDDDLIFNDNYEALILQEFQNHPEAEAIKFNVYNISKTRVSMQFSDKYQKATRRNVASRGMCAVAIRRHIVMEKNLRFNETFGAGTENYCGEDTIFLQEMINKKVKFYLSPVEIAGIDQSESTWFEGYTDKYFQTLGMTIGYIYPKVAKLITIRSSYKFSKRSDCHMGFIELLRNYWIGIDKIRKMNKR